jgi:hypothetical protein
VPEDYEPEDLLNMTENVNFELNKDYIIVVSYDVDGATVSSLVELMPTSMEETFSLNVSHFASGVDPVDIIDIDSTMVLIDDLALGLTSENLELSVAEDYNLGLDVDQDGVSDVDITIAAGDMVAGETLNVSAYFRSGELMLGITLLSDGDLGFDALPTGILAPPPEPMTTDELSANLPYSSGTYSTNEGYGLYDPSSIGIMAPDGSASITITLDFDTESCCDDIVILDIDGTEVYRNAGSETGVEVVVPGAYALIGFDSDGSVQGDGYTITAISVQ